MPADQPDDAELVRRLRKQRYAENVGEPCARWVDAVSAADRIEALTLWRPIATAPTEPFDRFSDGPAVQVLIPYDVPVVSEGWWSHDDQCWRTTGDDGPGDIQPTHWLPFALSTPPSPEPTDER